MSSSACFPDHVASRVPLRAACTTLAHALSIESWLITPSGWRGLRAHKQHATMTCVLASAGQTAKQVLSRDPRHRTINTRAIVCSETRTTSPHGRWQSHFSMRYAHRALQAVLAALPLGPHLETSLQPTCRLTAVVVTVSMSSL